jgi:TolB-like protein
MRLLPRVLALTLVARAIYAQCPDGAPPPCATARPVARAAVAVPAAADRARRFLILPFRNVTRQAEQDWLVEGSTTMLSDALSRWQGITVVPDEKLYPALKRANIAVGAVVDPPTVRRVAEETGGWTAVTGEVLATGGRLRITARAWDVPTNRQLVRASSEIATGGDVREAFDSVSLRLLQSVGIDSTPDLANATTRDLDAYRAYLRGLAHQRRAEIKSALSAFEEAIRRDSSFALAWARLADVTVAAEPLAIMNPMSRAAQYSARAVALSTKLPPRQRLIVQATNAQFRAQFGETRRIAEQLLQQDSTDVEALQILSAVESFDPVLVPVPGGQRPRGTPAAAARAARRLSQFDPSRYSVFGQLAGLYAGAGVPGSNPVIGMTREPGSFAEMMQIAQQRESVRFFHTIMRDTLALIPLESLTVIPKDTLNAMRKAARIVSRSWAERWLAAAPDQAAPHQLMSVLLMYDHEYAGALRELATAESIGVQTPAWSAPARRLVIVGRANDLRNAGRLADSLTTSGFFANPNNLVASGDAAIWSFTTHILRARVANAVTVLQQLTGMRRMMAPTAPNPEFTAFSMLMGNQDPLDEPGITRAIRGAQLDSTLAHIAEFAASPQISPWLPLMLPMFAEVADTSLARLPELLPAADALAAKGQATLAYQIVSNAVASDSTLEAKAGAYPWYRSGAEALNATRNATKARFKPGTATISGTQAVFEWRVDDTAPFTRHRAETPPGRTEYRWDVIVQTGNRYYRLTTNSGAKPAGAAPASGTLADLLPVSVNRAVLTGSANADGAMKDTTRLPSVVLRTETAPGVFRMIVTDQSVIEPLRRSRPTHARFRFEPCVTPVGVVGQRQCLDERIPITYAP